MRQIAPIHGGGFADGARPWAPHSTNTPNAGSRIQSIVRKEYMNEVRVRFAPSPTGYLHIGGA
ncbi:MAG: hypothetical protein K6360_08945, partial [Deltaproteobacteria bacterium]